MEALWHDRIGQLHTQSILHFRGRKEQAATKRSEAMSFAAGLRSPRIDTGPVLSSVLPSFSTTAINSYSELMVFFGTLYLSMEVFAFGFLSC